MGERSESQGIVVAAVMALLLVFLLAAGAVFVLFLGYTRQQRAIEMTQVARLAQFEAETARAAAEQAHRQAAETRVASAERDDASADKPENFSGEITALLANQANAWNTGNIEAFMEYYWKSDELTFSSAGQTTRGWKQTLNRYRERYPTAARMGKLQFDNLEVFPLDGAGAFVLGVWRIERESEPVQGNFSIILRKLEGQWRIVHDHTSELKK